MYQNVDNVDDDDDDEDDDDEDEDEDEDERKMEHIWTYAFRSYTYYICTVYKTDKYNCHLSYIVIY